MSNKIDPKYAIYAKLSELTTAFPALKVYEEQPEINESLPSITYRVGDDVPAYTLNDGVGLQDIVVVVDIWAVTSIESGEILVALEAKMRELGYLLSFSPDILEPDGKSHITTQFVGKI